MVSGRCRGARVGRRGERGKNRYALEARMTAQDPALYFRDALALDAHQTQPHLQYDVLHRKICRHAAREDFLVCLRFLLPARKEIQGARLVKADVGGCDPLPLAVIVVGGVFVDGGG